MKQWVEGLPHSCGTKKGLWVVREGGKYSGFCFACNTYVPDPYEGNEPKNIPDKSEKDKTKELNKLIEALDGTPFVDIPSRKLRAGTCEYFGIKAIFQDKEEILHYYPYYNIEGDICAYKVRYVPTKQMWSVGNLKDAVCFGWHEAVRAGGKKLFITEGELDAPSLWQVIRDCSGTKYQDYYPSVVSLVNGSSGVLRDLSKLRPSMNIHFKQTVLAFDMDDAGKKAIDAAIGLIPDALVVEMPGKDPSECLVDGKDRQLHRAAVFNAHAPKNSRIIKIEDMFEAGSKRPEWGLSWPFETLTDLTRGMRFGETYYMGAGVKMGKSEVLNTVATHLVIEHNIKCFLAKPEEAVTKTVKLLAGKIVGKKFHDPKVEFDKEAYWKACELLRGKIELFDLYQAMTWDLLKEDIRAAVVDGCKAIFIDPITNLTMGMSSSEANSHLEKIALELSILSKDLDVITFIFCHLKAPDSGPPHEKGGSVLSTQFAGSRAMMRSCNYMFGIEGNKDPDLEPEERNMRKILLLEDREFGESGYCNVYWNPITTLFTEIKD